MIMCMETVLGTLRILYVAPYLGDLGARQIGAVTSSLLILFLVYLFIHRFREAADGQLVVIGSAWVALTLLFEFVLGRLILKQSWERLLSDYDILHGGLMPFGLIVFLFSPLLARKLSNAWS